MEEDDIFNLADKRAKLQITQSLLNAFCEHTKMDESLLLQSQQEGIKEDSKPLQNSINKMQESLKLERGFYSKLQETKKSQAEWKDFNVLTNTQLVCDGSHVIGLIHGKEVIFEETDSSSKIWQKIGNKPECIDKD